MSSPVIWGPNNTANNLQGALGFSNGAGPVIIAPASPVDPTLTAVSASKGSLYLNSTTGVTYVKQDAGLTTNWLMMSGSTVVTNWKDDTANFAPTNFGTVTGAKFYSRRVGDSLEVQGYFVAGTVTGSQANIEIFTYVIDSAKAVTATNGSVLGALFTNNAGAGPGVYGTTGQVGNVFFDGSVTNILFLSVSWASAAINKDPANAIVGNNGSVVVRFTIPVVGWSAADALISPATVIAASYYNATTSGIGPASPGVFDTLIYDTTSSYNTTTGQFEVPVGGAGKYRLSAFMNLSSVSFGLVSIYKNGTQAVPVGYQGIGTSLTICSGEIDAADGDTLDIRTGAAVNLNGGVANADSSTIYIARLAPQGSGGGGGSGITRSVSNISAPTTLGAVALTDYVALVTGTTTVTLPTAVGNTNRYTVKNAGAATVTVAFTGGQTADGNATITLAPPLSVDLISDNSNWSVI